jgi:membrane fusion protein, multidrug efflux system
MSMKHLPRIIIILLLIALLGLTLHNNRKQTRMLIELSSAQPAEVPVLVTIAAKGELEQVVRLPGTLVPRSEVMVLSQTQGTVMELLCAVGSRVRPGEVLLRVDSELIGAEFQVAESAFRKSSDDFERARRLLAGEAITEQQYGGLRLALEAAEARYIAARKRFEDSSVKAPIAGTVNQVFVRQGALLGPGAPVCEIVGSSGLRLQARVTEQEIALLREGMRAQIQVSGLGGRQFQGFITGMAAKADMSMQYLVEIDPGLPDDGSVYAGMIAEASVILADSTPAFILPRRALLGTARHPEIFIVENGKAAHRRLELLGASGQHIKVSGDLTEGDQVVISGQNNLSEGMRVRIIQDQAP